MPELAPFAQMIESLRDPSRYAALDFPPGVGRPARIELLETHISCVLLAGVHAYKIKKPVNLGFLDFTTLAARRFYCQEELRLNRRTAPSLYIDVVPIAGSPSKPLLGAKGKAIDYAVRMRRFPGEALLDRMAKERELVPAILEQLGASVAAFHLALPPSAARRGFASAAQVLAAAVQNFEQIEAMAPPPAESRALERLQAWTRREHARLASVFAARKRGAFVRECHGDLHLGNIVLLAGEPALFDCVEFNAAFRWIDVMNEVAFLVMDLEEHGYPALAFRFLNRYLEATGDYAGLRVLRFYVAYRAMVRAKVACIRGGQPGADAQTRAQAANEFSKYVRFAETVAAGGQGALLLMHGLSGSGKSTIAKRLAVALDAIHLRSDVERKRLHGLQAGARTASTPGAGIYGPNSTVRTYERLAELARHSVSAGYVAIVDATFLEKRHRAAFRKLAREAGVPFAIVSCAAPDATLRERVARREAQGTDASEAGPEVLARQLATFEPLTGNEAREAMTFDSSGAADRLLSVVAGLAERGFKRRTG